MLSHTLLFCLFLVGLGQEWEEPDYEVTESGLQQQFSPHNPHMATHLLVVLALALIGIL